MADAMSCPGACEIWHSAKLLQKQFLTGFKATFVSHPNAKQAKRHIV
jgi:hypothetical protein